MVDTLNGIYADATLLVARFLCGRTDITDARALALTVDGFQVLAIGATREEAVTVPYANPLTDVDHVWAEVFGMVLRARELSGEEGSTSVERVLAASSGFRTHFTTVSAVADIGPDLRQITFRGGDLDEAFSPIGPDTFLYLLLPPTGRTEMTIDHSFSWNTVGDMPVGEQPVGGYYTVRRWDPATTELDIVMVLHGDSGPASAWALQAAVGNPVALWGPRTAWTPPDDTGSYLLVADETGLPAAAVILETLPAGTPIHLFAEVADEAHQQALPERDDQTAVTWLHRGEAEVGTTTLIGEAVRALTPPVGLPYVWGGGESRAMTAVRKVVRREWGVSHDRVSLTPYWRHRAHEADPVDADA